MIPPGYPEGYRDPPWDGSMEQYRDVVIPARVAALAQSFTATLPEWAREAGMRFEWGPGEREEPDGQRQA